MSATLRDVEEAYEQAMTGNTEPEVAVTTLDALRHLCSKTECGPGVLLFLERTKKFDGSRGVLLTQQTIQLME